MIEVIAIILTSILGGTLALVIIGLLIVFVVRVSVGALRGESSAIASDDVRLIQDLHRGLARMENRVETLETILLERGEEIESGRKNPLS
jgi:phage shock protein B